MPLSFVRHDITKLATDAIVNAANVDLLPGGGVCGAIFGAAGYEAMNDACRRIGHVDTGAAVATPGFALPARYVIHTAGPVWHGGTQGEEELLASCYRSSLVLAAELGCRSIAFPLISAGIYGYPRADAFAVAVSAIRAYLVDDPDMEVTLCLFDRSATTLAEGLFGAVQHYIDDSFVESNPYQRRVLEGHYSTVLESPTVLESAAPSVPASPAPDPFVPASPTPAPSMPAGDAPAAPAPSSAIASPVAAPSAPASPAPAPSVPAAPSALAGTALAAPAPSSATTSSASSAPDASPLSSLTMPAPAAPGPWPASYPAAPAPSAPTAPAAFPSVSPLEASSDSLVPDYPAAPAPPAPAAPAAFPSVTPLEAFSDSPASDAREAAPSSERPTSGAHTDATRHEARAKKGRGLKQLFQSAAEALRPEGSRRAERNAAVEANSVALSSDMLSPEETSTLPPLDELLLHLDASFADTLLAMIDERGLSDAEVYGRANLSRQYFSKLRLGQVNPSKRVVCALAVALGLTLDETTLLLERAGHALTHASRFDIIVEWFILQGSYDVFEINQALFRFDQPLLGTS